MSETGLAATRGFKMEIDRLKDAAAVLGDMVAVLNDLSDKEDNSGRQMALELARLEVGRLMQDYNKEALRLSLTASVESGG